MILKPDIELTAEMSDFRLPWKYESWHTRHTVACLFQRTERVRSCRVTFVYHPSFITKCVVQLQGILFIELYRLQVLALSNKRYPKLAQTFSVVSLATKFVQIVEESIKDWYSGQNELGSTCLPLEHCPVSTRHQIFTMLILKCSPGMVVCTLNPNLEIIPTLRLLNQVLEKFTINRLH